MSAEQVGLVLDIMLIVAVLALAVAGVLSYVTTKTVDPSIQSILLAVVGLLQVRISTHLASVKSNVQNVVDSTASKDSPPKGG